MINGMYLSTMGAMVQAARHSTVANNLANANTVGFKPDWTQFQDLPAESVLQGNRRRAVDDILVKTGGGVWLDRTVTDFSPGSYRQTGNPLHMALHDVDGQTRFFMVKNQNDSAVYLTRAGSFTLGNNGELLTESGEQVLDGGGQPITLPAGIIPGVLPDGTIQDLRTNPAAVVAQVGIMATSEPQKMRKIGNGLFETQDAEVAVEQSGVVSGTLEESSANAIGEMVEMIEGARMYESNMKFLSMQDETLASIVSKVGALA